MRLKIACSPFLNPLTGLVYFAFLQPASSNPCDQNEICVRYIEQPFNVWYVWVFLILLLIFILRCLISCCLQCWIKRRARYSSRHTVTVVTLSSLDSVYGK
ncbi:transmembrane protein 207 [Xenopus tropicalis]|uniref:Transmembrane protein 207 n=1 Tax=Xenopus tropicalis TaxID=8364 RepID=A0A8J1JLU9_XENTR|nr:transmembrane protein 207 [Xenopus tropicalis]